MADIEIIQIPMEMVGAMLPHLGPHLLRGASAEPEQVNVKDTIDRIVDGRIQMWAIMTPDEIHAAFLTSVLSNDDGTFDLDVYGLGGAGILKWGKLISDRMTSFAKFTGCKRIVFSGRKALLKAYDGVQITARRPDGLYQFERRVVA